LKSGCACPIFELLRQIASYVALPVSLVCHELRQADWSDKPVASANSHEELIMSNYYVEPNLSRELDRLQRQMSSLFGGFPASIRAGRADAFPPLNIGATDDTIEVVAFAPGLSPNEIDVSIEKGLLSISGERKPAQTLQGEGRTYAQERFTGVFRRVVELPPHADPDRVQASYANGCLCIRIGKREASKPRTIAVQ
jgi:HSP20 family protein